jgi:drug/metabolite transporter (DMT)-like permease
MHTSNAYILPAVLVAVLNVFATCLQFRAYKYADASLVSPIANLLPIFLMITSFFVLKTLPNVTGFVGIIFVVAGVYYTSVSGRHQLMHPLRQILKNRGSRAMLGTVMIWSISGVTEKIALRSASPAFLLVFQGLIMLVLISLYLLLQPRRKRLQRGERVMKKWGWHIVAIAVFATLSVFFQLHALALVDPSYLMTVKRLDVLFTVILAGVFLGEKHIFKRLQGSAVALIGVAIIYLYR